MHSSDLSPTSLDSPTMHSGGLPPLWGVSQHAQQRPASPHTGILPACTAVACPLSWDSPSMRSDGLPPHAGTLPACTAMACPHILGLSQQAQRWLYPPWRWIYRPIATEAPYFSAKTGRALGLLTERAAQNYSHVQISHRNPNWFRSDKTLNSVLRPHQPHFKGFIAPRG